MGMGEKQLAHNVKNWVNSVSCYERSAVAAFDFTASAHEIDG